MISLARDDQMPGKRLGSAGHSQTDFFVYKQTCLAKNEGQLYQHIAGNRHI